MGKMLVGFLLYPNLTPLDLVGPLEVIARIPGIAVSLIGASNDPVKTDKGVSFLPTTDIRTIEELDIFVVPGGPGADDAMLDPVLVSFVNAQASKAKWVLGICTGTLLLGAAGILRNRRSTGHWQSRELLSLFGADVSEERVTTDGNLVTSAGVTAGIDAALRLVAFVAGEAVAKQIQLQIEYAPEPPFDCGSIRSSDPSTLEAVLSLTARRREKRHQAVVLASRTPDEDGKAWA